MNFEHFKNLLAHCPHHDIEKWRQYQILYDDLDYQTKILLETICQGRFLQKDENQGWDLFEDLAEKIIQWEPTPKMSKNTNPISSKGGLYYIESFIAAEAEISSLMRRMKALEIKYPAVVNQVN